MYIPEGMVWTFAREEPSSFETLGSQFSVIESRDLTIITVPQVRVLWDSGQTQSWSSLGPKVRIQTNESLQYAFWDVV